MTIHRPRPGARPVPHRGIEGSAVLETSTSVLAYGDRNGPRNGVRASAQAELRPRCRPQWEEQPCRERFAANPDAPRPARQWRLGLGFLRMRNRAVWIDSRAQLRTSARTRSPPAPIYLRQPRRLARPAQPAMAWTTIACLPWQAVGLRSLILGLRATSGKANRSSKWRPCAERNIPAFPIFQPVSRKIGKSTLCTPNLSIRRWTFRGPVLDSEPSKGSLQVPSREAKTSVPAAPMQCSSAEGPRIHPARGSAPTRGAIRRKTLSPRPARGERGRVRGFRIRS